MEQEGENVKNQVWNFDRIDAGCVLRVWNRF